MTEVFENSSDSEDASYIQFIETNEMPKAETDLKFVRIGRNYLQCSRRVDRRHNKKFEIIFSNEVYIERPSHYQYLIKHDVNTYFKAACSVTGEWAFEEARNGRAPEAARGVRARLRPRLEQRREIPLELRTLAEMLEPQPAMAAVIARYLDWAEREVAALHAGKPPPAFGTPDGEPIFPSGEEELWLTEVQPSQGKGIRYGYRGWPALGRGRPE